MEMMRRFVWKILVLSIKKKVHQFFGKGFRFLENLCQSIENVETFQIIADLSNGGLF